MRLSILIYSMAGGGAERVISYLIPFLKKRGHEVHLVLLNNTIKYTLPEDLPIHFLENSKPGEAGILKWIKLPFLAMKYAKLLKKLEITHSFSLLTRPNYINILTRYFTRHPFRMIISERNYPSLQYGYGDLQSKINRWMVKLLYNKADLIISNARASAEDLAENFKCDADKISFIYNPIDTKKLDKIEPKRDFFDPGYFNIISVGRLEVAKNHQLIIRALKGYPKVRLYMLGHGPLKKELESLIVSLGLSDRIFLLGFEPNPYQYLKRADLFVLSSNHEGFPNVLLEAMCCGLPILSTNCKSGPEEMLELKEPKQDEIMVTEYGVLIPVGSQDHMKEGLAYCIKDPEFLKTCSLNAKRRILSYEKETILSSYEEILKGKEVS